MKAIPTVFPLLAQIDNAIDLTKQLAVQQFAAGYTCGKRETWLHMGLLGICCFIGGGVFVAGWAHLILRALT